MLPVVLGVRGCGSPRPVTDAGAASDVGQVGQVRFAVAARRVSLLPLCAPNGNVGRSANVFGPEKYERLRDLKKKWDPTNLFHLNQNIRPAS